MEVSSSAVTGAMKVGLQIISSHKKPVLEIYHQVRNVFGPETEYQVPKGASGKELETLKSRFQDIFIEFTLLNIGGERAENVKMSIDGNLKRNEPNDDFGDLFETIIPQMAPGQTRFLFKFRDIDLNEYPEEGGSSLGLKKDSFTITIEYDASSSLLNKIIAIPYRLMRKRRYRSTFTFFPEMVAGDLPPAEYAA